MSDKAGRMAGAALAAFVAAALLIAGSAGVSRAQTSGWNTYSAGHVSFQYPPSWTAVSPPQGDLVAYDSPDGVVEVQLATGSPDSPTATQELQEILDGHAADPNGYPNFRVIQPPTAVQVPGASDAATDEYVYTYTSGPEAGTLQHFFSRVAFQNGNYYWIVIIVTDSQLSQYQDQVNQILNSFQLAS
jgi:hypothetical protein